MKVNAASYVAHCCKSGIVYFRYISGKCIIGYVVRSLVCYRCLDRSPDHLFTIYRLTRVKISVQATNVADTEKNELRIMFFHCGEVDMRNVRVQYMK